MTTNARVFTADSAHWYYTDGRPCYELEKKDGKGMKAPTLADARKLQLLPSVTNMLRVLDKPALNDWKVEQGVLAVLTTPRLDGETDDAFVHRVLHTERVQDQEMTTARDKGTAIHDALEDYFLGREGPSDLKEWIEPAAKAIAARGERVAVETILIGEGFAGRLDLIQEAPECWWIVDWKTTKNLPDPKKGAWTEHRIQLAAYAAAWMRKLAHNGEAVPNKPVRTSNIYISTLEPGAFVVCDHDPDWQKTFSQGFMPLLTYWQWANNYVPVQ